MHKVRRSDRTDFPVAEKACAGEWSKRTPEHLRIVAYGFLFYAYGMVLGQSFNGAGDTWTPTIINLFVFWLWEIPLAYILGVQLGWGPRGVFIAMTIAFSTLALVSGVVFRRGKWKRKTV